MRFLLLFIFITTFSHLACENGIQSSHSKQANPIVMADPDGFDRNDLPDGSYQVYNVYIADDTLHLRASLQYEVQSDIQLVAWNYWLESNPVQVYVLLSVSERKDRQKNDYEQDLAFDLMQLKDNFLRAYSNSQGTASMIIRIRDPHHPQPDNAWVLYEFEIN